MSSNPANAAALTRLDAAVLAKVEDSDPGLSEEKLAELQLEAAKVGIDLNLSQFRVRSLLGDYTTRGFQGLIAAWCMECREGMSVEMANIRREMARARTATKQQKLAARLHNCIQSHTALATIELKLTEVAGVRTSEKRSKGSLPDIKMGVGFITVNPGGGENGQNPPSGPTIKV